MFQSRLLRVVQIIGLGCLIISIPNIIGEAVPYFENNVTDIKTLVQQEAAKLNMAKEVNITIMVDKNLEHSFLRALTRWKKDDNGNITIIFYNNGATLSIIKHEAFHAYRVSILKDLNPNAGFLIKRREELLANIYALTGLNLTGTL